MNGEISIRVRMLLWSLAGVLLIAFLAWRSPAQLPVIAYKLCLLTIAVCVAHLVDRTFAIDDDQDTARALVFVGVVLGLTLGL